MQHISWAVSFVTASVSHTRLTWAVSFVTASVSHTRLTWVYRLSYSLSQSYKANLVCVVCVTASASHTRLTWSVSFELQPQPVIQG